ncbi:hypothetical protein [Paenibacillus turpanensis]|uniref:hypothetical protein n=1 Tax=Paenibacillus turpanensis TaxID=2689078 RepID=UPI00140D2D92|nr:hypothetical protein [Paenibacillus turpanensis]
MYWEGWTLERWSVLFVSVAFLMIGIQVTLYHSRQNFRNKAMWVPVIEAPIFFLIGLLLTFSRTDGLVTLFMWMMGLAVLSGFIGFYFHTRGMSSRVGGWTMQNILIGPPIVLPLMLSALGGFGWLIFYL